MNEDWLFEAQRVHPTMYDVILQGQKERTVSIRAGLSWPRSDAPGYAVFVAQLERKDRDGNLRFLAFHEETADLKSHFFRKIGSACNRWRVDGLVYGSKRRRITMGKGPDENLSFAEHLFADLRQKVKRYGILQMPNIGASWRSDNEEFLVSLVRDMIATRALIFFQLSDEKTPLLLDKVRNADMTSNILEVPELKALAHVMDDFDCSPWRPREPPRKKHESAWDM